MGSELDASGAKNLIELVPLAYEELRRLARGRVARLGPSASLSPTDLVNEVLLRLIQQRDHRYMDLKHLVRVASLAMHNIMVDAARKRSCAKRGGQAQRVKFDDDLPIAAPVADMLSVNEACESLRAHSESHFELVLLRVYAGLTIEEIAAQRGQSTRTVERQWKLAKAMIASHMQDGCIQSEGGATLPQ